MLMPQNPQLLDFQITLEAWRRIPGLRPRLQKAAQTVIEHLPRARQFPWTATILLAGNAKVRQLNRDFRGMNKPTNVLSFPQFRPAALKRLPRPKEAVEIGDIALAYQYIVAEAKKDHKILIDHITHLVIHGLLHLLGYDHLEEREAVRMEKLEIKIMKAMGLADPYAPQSGRQP